MYAIVDADDDVSDESNETDNVGGPVEIGWGSTSVNTLRVATPNGGESIEQLESFEVIWASTGNPGPDVFLEISINGGATWDGIAGPLARGDLGYTWIVDADPSIDCRLRISNSEGNVTDVSDGTFEITAEGSSAQGLYGTGCSPAHRKAGPETWLTVCIALGACFAARRRLVCGSPPRSLRSL